MEDIEMGDFLKINESQVNRFSDINKKDFELNNTQDRSIIPKSVKNE